MPLADLGYDPVTLLARSFPSLSVAQRSVDLSSERAPENTFVVPQPDSSALTSVFDGVTQFTVTVFGLVTGWRGRAAACSELQKLLSLEFAMIFDGDASQSSAWDKNPLSRRQALIAIAALPYGLVAAARHTGTGVVAEEFLPQCTASITACWHLMQGQEFLVVGQSISQYLPALSTLAQQSSLYQQSAAGLASQSHFLLSHLALHNLRFKDRVTHCKQAAEYGRVAGDRCLEVSALCTLADAYFQLGNLPSQLRTYQQAAQMLDGLPLVLQSKVLGGLAHAYAQQGQGQEVARYVGEARVALTPEAHKQQLPLYLAMDYGPVQAMQYEGQAWIDLGDHLGDHAYYQQAANTFQLVRQLPNDLAVPERIRVEIVNQRAMVAVHNGDLDLFRELLIQGAEGAHTLASEKRHQEVVANWKAARKMWPHERRVLELADLLLE